MNRRQIYLTDYEVEEIKKYAFELGISMSEYIRRVIDEHLEKKKKKVATAGI
jgi:predicted DNA binding CopG/RHH family protein